MRIALDARALTVPRTGGGNYVYHLTRAMAKINPANEFFLCAHRELSFHPDDWGSNVRIRVNCYPTGVIWQQGGLPLILRRMGVELFHGTLFTLPLAGSLPMVLTVFDLSTLFYPETHRLKVRLTINPLLRQSIRKARKVIAISQHTRSDIIRFLQVNEGKVTAIPLAPAEEFQCLPSTDERVERWQVRYGKEQGFILYLGTLEPRKNLVTLVRAYADLRKRLQNNLPKLVLAGGKGWKNRELFRLIKELDLVEQVNFTGYVDAEDLPALYNAARLYVFPSSYEGFGLPVLEAMACGCPVVSSSASSLPEVAGNAAIYFNPDNEEELAEAIYTALTDEGKCREMIGKGLEQAKKFSWHNTAVKTLDVYREVLG